MTTELKVTLTMTDALNHAMHPQKGVVYKASSLPSFMDKHTIEWSNNDEQWIITFDRNTNILRGHTYEWDEDAQDWTDKGDKALSAIGISALIEKHKLLMVRSMGRA